MKLVSTIFAISVLLIGEPRGLSQGFANLNFESAQIVPVVGSPYYPYGIATTNALPSWIVTGYADTNPVTQITYNDPALGSSWVTLLATNGQQISGNFSVLLQGGLGPGISISQTGMVPVGTESLQFEAQSSLAAVAGSLVVSLGAQNVPFFALFIGSNYTLYGGDISTFAGQTQQLIISALTGGGNNWNIDNIQFSSSAVPEPSAFALGALGALLLGFRRWQKTSL